MRIIEKTVISKTKSVKYRIFPLGDVHIGALNCAEKEFRRVVRIIEKDPNAFWIGGGDYCDAVILGDAKRFDVNTLPNWMLSGGAKKVRKNMGDILKAQQDRFLEFVDPIKDKCLGLIEGNHEYSIFKYHNRDHMRRLCESLETPNLTDCAFIRFMMKLDQLSDETKRKRSNNGKTTPKLASQSATIFICHGHGGGRTSGSEPNRLYRLAADKDADIIFTGHSHSFHIHPPIPILGIPQTHILPTEPAVREKHAVNWGAYTYTYANGPSTYASRANYPVRPMYTANAVIDPFKSKTDADGHARRIFVTTIEPVKL